MTTVAEAIAAAYSRPIDTGPPDPLSAVRAELDRLAPLAPASATARQLVDVMGLPCVPVDRDSQQPTAERFTSLEDVVRHYRGNPADGCALLAGAHPSQTIVALRTTLAAWRQWLDEHCIEVRPITDEDGTQIAEDRVLRDLGRPALAFWTPPPAAPVRSVAAMGRAALQRAADDLLHGASRAQAQQSLLVCWSVELVWAVAPDEHARQARFRSRKLATSVELIAEGPVPWSLERDNGWTFGALTPPMSAPMPEHLVSALGGRWAAPVTAGGAR